MSLATKLADSTKQPLFLCNECQGTVGRRPAGTVRAYCWVCDRLVSIRIKIGRR